VTANLLAWRLRQFAAPIQVRPVGLRTSIRDGVALLSIDAQRATLGFRTRSVSIEPTQEVIAAARQCPEALWICDLLADEDNPRGDIVPFDPPRSGSLAVALPVEVPAALRAELEEIGLHAGASDLARDAVLEVGGQRVAVVGIPTLAAADDEDARSLTWWRPDGSALQ
jgi:hypothetical protein